MFNIFSSNYVSLTQAIISNNLFLPAIICEIELIIRPSKQGISDSTLSEVKYFEEKIS